MATEKKSFYVVEFTDRSTSVLPSSWIFRDDSGYKCHWNSSICKIKNYEIPNPRWPVCPIKRIVARRESYEEADRVCNDFQQTSGVEDMESNMQLDDIFVVIETERDPITSKKRKRQHKTSSLNVDPAGTGKYKHSSHARKPTPPPYAGKKSKTRKLVSDKRSRVESSSSFSSSRGAVWSPRLHSARQEEPCGVLVFIQLIKRSRVESSSSFSSSCDEFSNLGSMQDVELNGTTTQHQSTTYINSEDLAETADDTIFQPGLPYVASSPSHVMKPVHHNSSPIPRSSVPHSNGPVLSLSTSCEYINERSSLSVTAKTSLPKDVATGSHSPIPLSNQTASQQKPVACTPRSDGPVSSTSTSSEGINARSTQPPSVTAKTSVPKDVATVNPSNSPIPLSNQRVSQPASVMPRSNGQASTVVMSSGSIIARSSRPPSVTAETLLLTDVAETSPIWTVLKRLLHVVTETRDLVKDLKQEVASVKVNMGGCGDGSTEDYSDTIRLLDNPLDSVAGLLRFCNKLSNERAFRKQVVAILFSLDGGDTGTRTRRMLSKLISDELMAQFNYAGRGQKGKKSFRMLPALPEVMLDALKRHSNSPDMADVFKSTVQEFLKHAKSRIKSDEEEEAEEDSMDEDLSTSV